MYQMDKDARLQTTAGVALLNSSLLVSWDRADGRFHAKDSESFEREWKKAFGPPFGRLICWMQFSAGSEFFLKGICLANGIEIRKDISVPAYPSKSLSLSDWIKGYVADSKTHGLVNVTIYGTLGDLLYEKEKRVSPLSRLCSKVGASKDQQHEVFVAFDLLCRSIRNRDAHGYVPNIRESHHMVAATLVCNALNILVTLLPDGANAVSSWIEDAENFIDTL